MRDIGDQFLKLFFLLPDCISLAFGDLVQPYQLKQDFILQRVPGVQPQVLRADILSFENIVQDFRNLQREGSEDTADKGER